MAKLKGRIGMVSGVALIVLGICVAGYLGIWWAFIGGIVDVIQGIRAEEMVAMDIALGVAKVVFAGFIGWGSAIILCLPGFVLFSESK